MSQAHYHLPDTDGIKLCDQLTRQYPSLLVVLITVSDAQSVFYRMVKSSASGVMSKQQSTELPAVLSKLITGERYVDPSMSHAVVSLAESKSLVKQLSHVEYRILECYLAGLSVPQTSHQLGRDVQGIKNARRRLFYKLGTRDKDVLRSQLQ